MAQKRTATPQAPAQDILRDRIQHLLPAVKQGDLTGRLELPDNAAAREAAMAVNGLLDGMQAALEAEQSRFGLEMAREAAIRRKREEFSAREIARLGGELSRIAAGDFSIDPRAAASDSTLDEDTRDLSESFTPLNQGLAKAAAAARAFDAEVERLTAAAREGKLNDRGNVDVFHGTWSDMVRGMNAIFDAMAEPLRISTHYVDRIGKGDIPEVIADAWRGDFDELRRNLNASIEQLNGLIAGMNRMSEEHNKGDIDVSIADDRLNGAYKAMAQGINAMVAGHITVKKKAMACVAEFANGNFDAPLERFPGKKAFINENIERLRANIQLFIKEMNRMSDEHNKGDIDVTIPLDRFTGAYRVMAQGVNDMVSGHITVKKKAMACLAEFGRGNFEAQLERFPGKKAFINETFEQVRANLKSLITDMNQLAVAATEGQLSTRADASRHGGDFRKIVEGVNQTLEAVIGPLNVSAKYVEQISKGDVPPKITDTYRGDFNTIKNNLNVLIDAMNEITAASEDIARGNLKVKIVARSPQDKLMQALGDMVSGLTRVVVDIKTMAAEVTTGSSGLSTATTTVSQGASEQSASAEQASASMEQMVSNIKQNAENAHQTEKIAVKSAEDAREGGKSVNEAVNAMKEIASRISIIEEIARQTNMLALNAAIEAARAGEHGKGFAVVAAEVRKLAERSQKAAGEINQLSSSTVKLAEKAGETLALMVPNIQKTAELVQEISAASAEQNQGAEQINTALQQLQAVIQQNATGAEEMAATSEELNGQAEQMLQTINFFDIGEKAGGEFAGARRAPASERPASMEPRAPVAAAHLVNRARTPARSAPPAKKNGHRNGVALNMPNGAPADESFERY